MQARSLAVVIATVGVFVVPSLSAAAPALAEQQDPGGTVAYDLGSRPTTTDPFARRPFEASVNATTILGDGTLNITDSLNPYVRIRLVGGERLEPTTTYVIGNTSTTHRLTGMCSSPRTGELRVDDVTYVGDTLTTLVARYGVWCDSGGNRWVNATIRIGADLARSAVHPTPVNVGVVGRSSGVTRTLTLTNSGASPTATLGAAVVHQAVTGSADVSVTADRCAGTVLAPAATCEVEVRFERATAGSSSAVVHVPDTSSEGGRIVLAVWGTAVAAPAAPPLVSAFPARSGVGIAWGQSESGYGATGYRVERLEGSTWVAASGLLGQGVRSWVDTSPAAGSALTLRVVGENQDGPGTPSPSVTGTRPLAPPAVGTVDGIDMDAGLSGEYTAPTVRDVVATSGVRSELPVDVWPDRRERALVADTLSVVLPRDLPGPGDYAVGWIPSATERRLSVSSSQGWTCSPSSGVLHVDEVLFGSSLELETFAASYDLMCGNRRVTGDLRWRSTKPLRALRAGPPADAGSVLVGSSTTAVDVDVDNVGTSPLTLGSPSFTGDASADWRVTGSTCAATVAPAASCTVSVAATPSGSGPRAARLVIPDTTPRGAHSVVLTANGTSVPSAPTGLRADRLPGGGVELRWEMPADTGGAPWVAYRVSRSSPGGTTVLEATEGPGFPRLVDASAPGGSTYRVSAVNTVGEGAPTPAVTPLVSRDALVVAGSSGAEYASRAQALGLDGQRLVPLPLASGQTAFTEGAAASPDGTEFLTARQGATSGGVLWREALSGTPSSTPAVVSADAVVGRPSWSPDGRGYAFTTVEGAGSARTLHVGVLGGAETFALEGYTGGSWLPDARTLVSQRYLSQDELALVDSADGRVIGPVAGTAGGLLPTVSPDGRWIAFAKSVPSAWQVFVVPVQGGTPLPVGEPVAAVRDLSWSHSGSTLAMVLTQWGSTYVQLADVAVSGAVSNLRNPYADLGLRVYSATWVGPRVAIGPSAAVAAGAPTLTIDASAVSGATLTCSVDDGPATSCAGTFTPSTKVAGTHVARVRAQEAGGRVTVAARSFTIGQSRPAVFRALAPARVLDTRSGTGAPTGAVGANGVVRVKVTGRGGVPESGVSAVVLNVTVTRPQKGGHLTAYAGGTAMPSASNVNFVAGQTVPNLVVVPVGADGTVSLANVSPGSTHVLADVTGAFTTTPTATPGSFGGVAPARLLDTRTGTGAAAAPVAANRAVRVKVTGRGGVPESGVSAVVLNVTVTRPQKGGHLTAHAGGTAMPSASNVNFVAGQTVPNLVVVPVGADGTVSLANVSPGSTHVLADVFGYYVAGAPQSTGAFGALAPARLLDTRDGTGATAKPVAAGSSARVQVTGRGGVPSSGVSAVVLNVTVTRPQQGGHLTAHAGGSARPTASSLNFVAGQTVPNLVVVPVGADGTVSLANVSPGSTHVIADVFGWYRSGG